MTCEITLRDAFLRSMSPLVHRSDEITVGLMLGSGVVTTVGLTAVGKAVSSAVGMFEAAVGSAVRPTDVGTALGTVENAPPENTVGEVL